MSTLTIDSIVENNRDSIKDHYFDEIIFIKENIRKQMDLTMLYVKVSSLDPYVDDDKYTKSSLTALFILFSIRINIIRILRFCKDCI